MRGYYVIVNLFIKCWNNFIRCEKSKKNGLQMMRKFYKKIFLVAVELLVLCFWLGLDVDSFEKRQPKCIYFRVHWARLCQMENTKYFLLKLVFYSPIYRVFRCTKSIPPSVRLRYKCKRFAKKRRIDLCACGLYFVFFLYRNVKPLGILYQFQSLFINYMSKS